MQHRLVARLTMLAVIPALALSLLTPAWAESRPTESKPMLGVLVEATAPDAVHPGALVREVLPDGPAAKAGLKPGDVIHKLGDREVKDAKALVEALAGCKPGDKLTLAWWREGKVQRFEVTLAERPARSRATLPERLGVQSTAFLGIRTQPMTPELKDRLGVTVDQGAVVMQVMADSPAEQGGLKADDVVVTVNDQAIANPEELRAAVQKAGPGKEVTLKVMRGKEAKELKVKLGEVRKLSLDAFRSRWPWGEQSGWDAERMRWFEELEKRLRELPPRLEEPAK
jgi:S1-C subfamily serine protease